MNFGQAYSATEMGASVKRAIWPSGVYVRLQRPDANSLMTVRYLYVTAPNQLDGTIERMPWQPSQDELASDDWDYYDPGAAT